MRESARPNPKSQGDIFPPLPRGIIRTAVDALFYRGAHFVIVRADVKRPLWRAWNQRKPGPDTVMNALDAGHRIGIIPASIDRVVVDVDAGDPAAVAAVAKPGLTLTTDKPGRAHLYYRAGADSRNMQRRELVLDGGARLTVDVIHSHPFVIIYGWNLPPLAGAVGGGDGGRFPGELFDRDPARDKYNRRRAAIEDVSHAVKGRRAGDGRNCALFYNAWEMSLHDYPAGRLSHDSLLHYCVSLNEQFAEPLPVAEVEKTARSIWKFLEANFQTPPATPRPDDRKLSRRGQAAARAAFSKTQAWRAKRRGKAAAAAAAPDIKRALESRAAGDGVSDVAAALGKSERTVMRWTAMPATLDSTAALKTRARAMLADGVDVADVAAALDTQERTIYRWIDAAAARADRNARILAMHAAGESAPKIAAELKISRRTVMRALAAPMLTATPSRARN